MPEERLVFNPGCPMPEDVRTECAPYVAMIRKQLLLVETQLTPSPGGLTKEGAEAAWQLLQHCISFLDEVSKAIEGVWMDDEEDEPEPAPLLDALPDPDPQGELGASHV